VESKHGRARPLPRDDRRTAILTAVIPLLVERGSAATTAEMAEVAGVAEGTIFRAFPDKRALIHEAVKVIMDPGPVRQALEDIDGSLSLETQLAEAARILLDRFDRITTVVRIMHPRPDHDSGPPADALRHVAESIATISAALTALLERHRHLLVIEPARAAAAFRGLVSANAHPLTAPEERLTVDEIVSILLSGITRPSRDL
jgi:AcrR family transcriptional regulator